MAPRPPVGESDAGWTPRGAVMAGLMAVLAAVIVLSHFGASTAILVGVAALAAVIAVIVLYRLPIDANDGTGDTDV